MPASQQKRQRRSPGDATGRRQDQLQKEHAEEQAKRAAEMSVASQVDAEAVEHEITDLTGDTPTVIRDDGAEAQAFRDEQTRNLAPGTRQPGAEATEIAEDGIMYDTTDPDNVTKTNDSELLGTGPESPFPVVGGTPEDERVRRIVDRDSRGFVAQNVVEVQDVGVRLAENETSIVRVNGDLEMTFGVGNNYTFKDGHRYKVPSPVAQHLEEKGYLWH